MQHLGHTRSRRHAHYTLHTPDAFVRAPLPGMHHCTAIVHISPHLGAGFTQYTAELAAGGNLGLVPADFSRFVFVQQGVARLSVGADHHDLGTGGYAFLPPSVPHQVFSDQETRLVVIEKPYQPLDGVAAPELLVGSVQDVQVKPLPGEDRIELRTLLPDQPAFDFAVNVMTYPAGISLPFVEMHVMEHGLVMLEGEGVYLLHEDHHPVKAGDVIYMAPYCPQWFTAIGGQSAYLIYKDVNRHPHP